MTTWKTTVAALALGAAAVVCFLAGCAAELTCAEDALDQFKQCLDEADAQGDSAATDNPPGLVHLP